MQPSCNETADLNIPRKVVLFRLSFRVLNTVGDICTDPNDLEVSVATHSVTVDWKRQTKRSMSFYEIGPTGGSIRVQ